MQTTKTLEPIVLRLSDIRDLFRAPEEDPFAEGEAEFTGQSGLERVVRRLESESLRREVPALTIVLPKEKVTPGIAAQINTALDRFCNLKIEENIRHIRILRKEGFHSLLKGLAFLALCLGLAAFIESSVFPFAWSDVLRRIFAEGLTIIGWVVLWHPVEAFLYEPGAFADENRVYDFLRRLDVTVVGEE